MALYIVSVSPPDNPVVSADCRIPCTVKNTDSVKREVKVYLYDNDPKSVFSGDMQPTLHWQDIDSNEEYSFDGFWDTLHFTPIPPIRTYHMRIELHEKTLGKVDSEDFDLDLIHRPDWWGSLMDSVATGNIEQIAEPILGLFTGFDIEGFTKPPYICFICSEEFDTDDEFANHLISHIQAFIGGWFE